MAISNNTSLGSFVLSFISPWRAVDSADLRLSKRKSKDIPTSQEHVNSTYVADAKSPHDATTAKPLEHKPLKFKPGHRRSRVSLLPASESSPLTPQEQISLSNFALTLRARVDDYHSRGNKENTSNASLAMASLPAIQEEPEEHHMDHKSSTRNSSLTCCPSEGDSASARSDSLTSVSEGGEERDILPPSAEGSVHRLPQQPPMTAASTDLDQTSTLRSEITLLKSQIATANQEIQNLNAELADTCDSGSLAQEAEERMEELLIEKSEWYKSQRALTENLAQVSADLQNAKHCKTLLQHDNERLRAIIKCYKASVESLHPLPTLPHQDSIDRQSAELVWPISALGASKADEEIRSSQLNHLLPPTANCDAVIKLCATTPNDTASSNSPTKAPFRSSSLRGMNSLRARTSSPLKRQASFISEGSSKGVPSNKKAYRNSEQSPLKSVTVPKKLSSGVETHPQPLPSNPRGFEPLSTREDEDEDDRTQFHSCYEGQNSSGGSSDDRTSRIGMLPGGFTEDIFL